jgi:branched-chain amino acid transport system substrate-binding protein
MFNLSLRHLTLKEKMMKSLQRRALNTSALALLASSVSGIVSAQSAKPINIGQTAALTGQLSLANVDVNRGILAHFDEINAKGGINGRPLRYLSLEDQADPEKAKANFRKLVDESGVVAMLATGGTVVTGALLPLVNESKIPMLAPVTGADQLRASFNPYAFHVRASYGTELARIVEQLSTIGQKKVALVHSDNAFGKGAAAGFLQLAKARNIEVTVVPVGDAPEDAAKSAKTLLAAEVSAIVSLYASPSLNGVELVRAYRKERAGTPWYTISLLGGRLTLDALGSAATGLTISQVMPYPFVSTTPIVRDYQAAIKRTKDPSVTHNSLEGYIAARILTQALKTLGKEPTGEKLAAALEARKIDLGGFEVTYTNTNHNGSRYTDLVIVGSRGNLVR